MYIVDIHFYGQIADYLLLKIHFTLPNSISVLLETLPGKFLNCSILRSLNWRLSTRPGHIDWGMSVCSAILHSKSSEEKHFTDLLAAGMPLWGMDPLAADLLVPQNMSGMISLEGTRVLLSLVIGTTGCCGGRGSPSRGGCNNIQLESTFWEHLRIHSIQTRIQFIINGPAWGWHKNSIYICTRRIQTLCIIVLNAHHVLQTLHDEADRVARPLNGLDSQLVVSRTQVHSVNLDVKCEGVENEFLYHACMHV